MGIQEEAQRPGGVEDDPMCYHHAARGTGGSCQHAACTLHAAEGDVFGRPPLARVGLSGRQQRLTLRLTADNVGHALSTVLTLRVLFGARILSPNPEVLGQGYKSYQQTGPSTPCVDRSCSVVFDWTSPASSEGRFTDTMQTPTCREHV